MGTMSFNEMLEHCRTVDPQEWKQRHPDARAFWTEDSGTFVLWLHDQHTNEVYIYRVLHDVKA